MAKKSLLLFAHQGRSYLALVLQALERLGVHCLVLSSRPRDPRDLDELQRLGPARLWHVEDEYLAESHVARVLQEAQAEGFEVIGALATFEGYRALMAQTNRALNAVDADPDAIAHCMDKYLCRQSLVEQGLSRSTATLLDADTLDALRLSGRKLFVKPRRGAGSFACFRLDDSLTVDKLHALQQQMRDDLAFRAIFAGQFDFIAEDYIAGDEYSFEVLVAQGESYVIGVHAKYLDDSTGTTLETSNSCPAPRLTDAQQLAGERYIDQCLSALHLWEGCYHIEARHDPQEGHWDIIEINARMGGALINQSIGVFTGGLSVLELWVRALCSRSEPERAVFRTELSALRESTRRANNAIVHGTVFFSRYGERNRTLERISIEHLPRQPDIYDIPVREGARLPDSERGIFILNALWKVDLADIAQELNALSSMLDETLVVQYSDAV
ncbi:ATP-grasp domain-containing protein [Andreprevotia chitinilytica]|uniref:ATP-grasp domain-containing protein n=1 Tax=Andreprevotia chitinilytica TaxID=396808 RepID=UPI00054DDA91|nr:ATP-grasp domain-containing protein [Andreprevotia chitinilytica]